jgi:hypothetical protein
MKRRTRTGTRNLRTARPSDHNLRREEHEIFSELAALCVSPGFAHAIAYICDRDNLLRFGEELTPDDLSHFYSASVLVRTEIATLIGLLARQPIDFTLPEPSVLQHYLDRAQDLLRELHQALSFPWFKHFHPEAALGAEGPDPFSTGVALREPIFYGGESAYNFQYREFTEKKYANDQDWLLAHKGFDISTALAVADALYKLSVEQQTSICSP